MVKNPVWGSVLDTNDTFIKGSPKTLELETIRTQELYVNEDSNYMYPSTSLSLETDGKNGTSWGFRYTTSTIEGLGSAGYYSTIPMIGFHNAYISTLVLSTNTITLGFLNLSNGSISSYQDSNSPRTTLFTDGTISTHSAVVYGTNTLTLQGNLILQDKVYM